jgi:hypothetical protein
VANVLSIRGRRGTDRVVFTSFLTLVEVSAFSHWYRHPVGGRVVWPGPQALRGEEDALAYKARAARPFFEPLRL